MREKEQKKNKNLISKFCIFYLLVWSVSPPLGIDMSYRLLALGCAGMWFLIYLKNQSFCISREVFYSVLFVISVMAVSYVRFRSVDHILSDISLYMMAIAFIVQRFYRDKWYQLSGIALIIVILLVLFNYRTITELIVNPHISRYIVRDDEATYSHLRSGVGGYGLIYLQVCIFPMVLSWTLAAWRKNKLIFAVGAAWTVSFVWLVLICQYALAVAGSVLGLIVLFVYKKKSIVSALVISIILFAGALFLIVYSEGVRNLLLQIFDGSVVQKKINDLVASATSREAEGSILDRVEAYMNSINTILNYPLTGGLWRTGGGSHSEILDAFARFGVLGGYMYVKMLCSSMNDIKTFELTEKNRRANATLVSILFVGFLDTISYQFMFPILVLAPLLEYDIEKWSEQVQ